MFETLIACPSENPKHSISMEEIQLVYSLHKNEVDQDVMKI